MQRRQFMLVLGAGGAVITLSACDSMPMSAVAPWTSSRAAEPDARLRALSWAMLAPNPHNLQSWIADIREPELIRLHIDLQRLLPQTDPFNRQVLIGCGAFLELLCMAMSHDGIRTVVELFPEGEYRPDGVDARPFAQVRLVRDPTIEPDALFHAVRLRRTTRVPYTETIPDDNSLSLLAHATKRFATRFVATNNETKVQRIRDFAIEGYRVEFATEATWRESADLLRVGTDAVANDPSGVPVLGTGVWFARKLGLLNPAALRNTEGLVAHKAIKDSIDAANHTHAWLWLVSADNSRRSQLEAGRAYLRVDLAAAALGLAIQPNSQVLQEFAQMGPLYQRFHQEVEVSEPARVQMLARLGYANRPDPAPRRALSNIILI